MADRKRIVQINPFTGDVTTLIDLDDGVTYAAVNNTFQIQQGARGQALAQRSGRYGGADIASEQHENDKLSWQALVRGNTTDEVLENCEAMLIATERAVYDTFIEWRAKSASRSSFYAIRGPAEFELTHESIRLDAAKAEYVNVTFPIEPLARGAMYTQDIPTTNLPATWVIGAENLVTNPAFEGNATTGYTAYNGGTATVTITSSTSAPHAGTYGCRVQRTASTGNSGIQTNVPVVGGGTYTFGGWVRPSSATMGGDQITVNVDFLDGSSTYMSTQQVSIPWTATNTWQRVSLTVEVPAGARTAACYFIANGITNGDYFDVDQVSFVVGSDDTYFDGATSGCSWRGTANASVSVNPTLGKGIDGTAPALMDVAFRHTTTGAPLWALFAWCKKPTTPLSSSVAPFGLIEAETAEEYYTFTPVTSDATWHNSAGFTATVTTAGSAGATFIVDPSTMEPDDFTRSTIDIEVWARIKISNTLLSPRITMCAFPSYPGGGFWAGNPTFGPPQYTPEYGAFGKIIQNLPSATNTKFRPVRLGTLTFPVDKANPVKWTVALQFLWANSSSSTIGLDYLVMVPARRRACSRSGVPGASADYYPAYIASNADTNKIIRSDLSGLAAAGTGTFVTTPGMGGSTIEPQAGDTSLFVWPSNLVPDDPQAINSEHIVAWPNPTGKLYITPRYYLVR